MHASANAIANPIGNPIGNPTDANHRQWQRILHYKKTIFGFESEIDSPVFFLSEKGKSNPEAELLATVKGLLEENAADKEENKISCRFPLRRKWLLKQNPQWQGQGGFSDLNCPTLQKWFSAVNGSSMSIIFSSYYLNNPASMFGHTFLKINKSESQSSANSFSLLDYGINYAANPDSDNPFIYSFKGLFGGFPGTFSIMPYYYKVREYNNAESRDLWEYQLNLSHDSIENLLFHIWELGPTYADYWYLTENCSYHVLTLLEAADDKLDLIVKTKKFVIPVDTLKTVVESPGLLHSLNYRPSIYSEYEKRVSFLDSEQKSILTHMLTTKSDELKNDEAFNEEQKVQIYDAAIDWVDQRYAYQVQKNDSPEFQHKSKLLLKRSQLAAKSQKLEFSSDRSDAPHKSRGSARWGVGAVSSKNQYGASFSFRFALQDLLDSVVGQSEASQIQFFDMDFSYIENKIHVDRFILYDVTTLTTWEQLSPRKAWRLKVGWDQSWHREFFQERNFVIAGGLGFAIELWSKGILYLGLQSEGRYFDHLSKKEFLGAGPIITFRQVSKEQFQLLLESKLLSNRLSTDRYFADLAIGFQYNLNKHSGIRWKLNTDFEQSKNQLEFLRSF